MASMNALFSACVWLFQSLPSTSSITCHSGRQGEGEGEGEGVRARAKGEGDGGSG